MYAHILFQESQQRNANYKNMKKVDRCKNRMEMAENTVTLNTNE